MNSADFYLLYLHLTNQKAIKKATLVTKLQNQKLGKHCFTKESFALLAFAGLRKTIAVAEWRNLFGYRAFDFKSEKFSDSQAFNSEFSLHYKHSYLQKASKLKALARFKKTVNPLTLPSNNPTALSRSLRALRADFTKVKVCGLTANSSLSFYETSHPRFKNLRRSEKTLASKSLVKSIIYKAKLGKRGLWALNKKWMSLFNQRILSQSFKKNFIQNLKNSEKPLFPSCLNENQSFLEESFGYVEYNKSPQTLNNRILNSFEPANLVQNQISIRRLRQGSSREDHQMDLASWAPILDLREFKPRTVATREVQPFEKRTSDRSLQITRKFMPQLKAYGLRKLSRIDSPANVVVGSSNFGAPAVSSPKGLTDLATAGNGLPGLLLAAKQGGQDFVETTYVSNIKDFFGGTKKEILLASPNLTKFYNAAWLLESIRTELSSRNANIKRVLNQTFLLTQQPLFNFSKKQTDKSTTLLKTTNSGGFEKKAVGHSLSSPVHKFSGQEASLSIDSTPLIREAAVIPYLIKGLRITFSGRLGGKKGMAKTLTKTTGRVPLSTLKEKVDFAKGVVQTKTGSLGVKVWICYN